MHFACPACSKVYGVEPGVAEIRCEGCGAAVAVPANPPREVLYGEPLPPPVDRRFRFGPPDSRQLVRRRQRAKRKTILKLIAFALFLVGIAAATLVIRNSLQLVADGKAKFR